MSDELHMGILLSKKRVLNPVLARKFLLLMVEEGLASGDVEMLTDERALNLANEFRSKLAANFLEQARQMELS